MASLGVLKDRATAAVFASRYTRDVAINVEGEIQDEEESKGDESVETAEVQAEKEEEKTPESNMSRSPSPEKNARAKAAIKQAHDSSSYDESSEKSTPSTTSDTGGPLCESMTILQEMSQLKREEDEICDEIKTCSKRRCF